MGGKSEQMDPHLVLKRITPVVRAMISMAIVQGCVRLMDCGQGMNPLVKVRVCLLLRCVSVIETLRLEG